MSLARKRFPRAGGGLNTVALQLLSAPGDARADHREQSSIDDFRRRNAGRRRDDEEAEHDAEAGCQQSRSEPAQAGGGQNRGNEQQVGRGISQDRRERESRQERDGHGDGRKRIAKRLLPNKKPMPKSAELALRAR